MADNLVTRSIKVNLKEWDRLKSILDKQGVSMSFVVRNAIIQEIKKRNKNG